MAGDNVMRRSIYVCLLVTSISVYSVIAGKAKLLRNLKSASYPWFGEAYKRNCPDSEANWPQCYNLRPNEQESIIRRAGLPDDTTLTTELEVVFSAPEEDIDVCGKDEPMSKVNEFILNEEGIAAESSLGLGAEIYRKQPKVNWDAKEGVMYTLIFWDVGFFKIRGWFYNIELKGSEMLGLTNSPYYPPANPTPNINPVLIMLLEQTNSTTSSTNETMNLCVETIPNPQRAERCRNSVITWLKDGLNLVGLQVYYTNGASLYEKFRACTESFICDKSCTDKFNGFYQRDQYITSKTAFITDQQKKLDFYVNFRFTGVTDKKLKYTCCQNLMRKKFEYRPRPGNNDSEIYVGMVSPMLFESRMTLEMSGPVDALRENDTYYSVVIFDIDALACLPGPYMHHVIANLEYPGRHLEMQNLKKNDYVPPWPGGEITHTYLIILYSHKEEMYMPGLAACGKEVDYSERYADARSVSWFQSSNSKVCRKLECPAVPDKENPLSFMGLYKASSDFPPEVSADENINSGDSEITTRISRNNTPTQVDSKLTTVKSGSCIPVVSISLLTTIVLVSVGGSLK
ncbi:unnamed protein product [Lymnaea stagnalis]|uniref:Uncharacterized protein n=1 Tax=Lymnaea stagnalis TaxID=6523 RepID=A0AAV2IJT0_LYMST